MFLFRRKSPIKKLQFLKIYQFYENFEILRKEQFSEAISEHAG